MLSTLHAVLPLTRGTYSDENDPDPIAWKGGALVEYLDVLDPAGGVTFRVTVGQAMNGYDPVAGEAVDLVCEHTIEDRIVFSKDGKPWNAPKHKLRAVEVRPATASKS